MVTSEELEDLFHDFLLRNQALDIFLSVHAKSGRAVRETLTRPAGMWIHCACCWALIHPLMEEFRKLERIDNSWRGVVDDFKTRGK